MTKDTRQTERQRQRETGPPVPLNPDTTDPAAHEPHHSLNNPASEPDSTEFPDPYDRRPDPRAPDSEDGDDAESNVPTPKPPSTSEPLPPRNYDEVKPEKGA